MSRKTSKVQEIAHYTYYMRYPIALNSMLNGAELGGATGAMAPLVFLVSKSKKVSKVSKSKSRSLEWHQLFLPSFGANDYLQIRGLCLIIGIHWQKYRHFCQAHTLKFLRTSQ